MATKFTRIGFFLLTFILAAAAFTGVTLAQPGSPERDKKEMLNSCLKQAKSDCVDWVTGVLGGEFPHGISINTFAELATGEKYYLDGRISIQNEVPYFEVDFDKQPWLKNAIRKAFPYYRIEDTSNRWGKWNGKTVELLVQAKQVTYLNSRDRTVVSELIVVPLQDPSSLKSNNASAPQCSTDSSQLH